LRVELYGSLGATGKGRATDRGVMLGPMGDAPDEVDPMAITHQLERVHRDRKLPVLGVHLIPFTPQEHFLFYRQALQEHPTVLSR
jgi:L-serine dehydratase